MAYTTIDNPELYFQTVLWSGDSTSPRTITFDGSEDMQPDWIWSKKRSGADYGQIYDSVRGFGASKEIVPSDNFEEGNATNSSVGLGFISSVTSDGFVLTEGNHGTSSIRSLLNNHSGSTHVAWGWKAGGSASSNTDGSITSSVSANTTAGFSIVSYTGTGSNATVGHGLGAVPKMIITKDRNNSNAWYVYHVGIGNTHGLRLSTSDAKEDDATLWNDTTPTSSVFSVGSNTGTNRSSNPIIAYCFADTGNKFFKAGSYIGNGSSSGPMIYTGFKPAMVIFKNTGTANRQWQLLDNKRSSSGGNNVINITISPNNNNDESWWGTNNYADFLSNGFKLRAGYDGVNESGGNYIYMAFAENPFVTSTGIPTTAR